MAARLGFYSLSGFRCAWDGSLGGRDGSLGGRDGSLGGRLIITN